MVPETRTTTPHISTVYVVLCQCDVLNFLTVSNDTFLSYSFALLFFSIAHLLQYLDLVCNSGTVWQPAERRFTVTYAQLTVNSTD